MGRRSSPCTQADIVRLIRAAKAAGIAEDRIAGVQLTRDGATLLFGDTKLAPSETPNEWDEVLQR